MKISLEGLSIFFYSMLVWISCLLIKSISFALRLLLLHNNYSNTQCLRTVVLLCLLILWVKNIGKSKHRFSLFNDVCGFSWRDLTFEREWPLSPGGVFIHKCGGSFWLSALTLLGLSNGGSTCDVFMCLGLPHSMPSSEWLDLYMAIQSSQSECSSEEEKLHWFLWPRLRYHTGSLSSHSISYKQITNPPRFKGRREHRLYLLMEGMPKHLQTCFKNIAHWETNLFPQWVLKENYRIVKVDLMEQFSGII